MTSEYTTRVSGDTSKWGLSASRQQCGDVEGASVSWNSDQGAGPARAYPAISIRLLLVELQFDRRFVAPSTVKLILALAPQSDLRMS
jgi:hypothetical protein